MGIEKAAGKPMFTIVRGREMEGVRAYTHVGEVQGSLDEALRRYQGQLDQGTSGDFVEIEYNDGANGNWTLTPKRLF